MEEGLRETIAWYTESYEPLRGCDTRIAATA